MRRPASRAVASQSAHAALPARDEPREARNGGKHMRVRSDRRSGFPDAEQVTVREGVSGVVGLASASATGTRQRFVLVFLPALGPCRASSGPFLGWPRV